jgi:uncharacterized membrane protein YfcA
LTHVAVLLIAGAVSGLLNAVAGGGSLLLFPALLAAGLPALPANVTNSVIQCCGFVGLALGSRRELREQQERVRAPAGVAAAGALVGSGLLLALPAKIFDAVVPALVALASLLLVTQPWLSRWIDKPQTRTRERRALLLLAIFLGGIYGGYFGGALGVLLIAVLALGTCDDLRTLNAIKGILSLIIGAVSGVVFTVGAPVDWPVVALLAPTNLLGGLLGAAVARRLPATALRLLVATVGCTVSIYLVVR